jgi:hypothetical protein
MSSTPAHDQGIVKANPASSTHDDESEPSSKGKGKDYEDVSNNDDSEDDDLSSSSEDEDQEDYAPSDSGGSSNDRKRKSTSSSDTQRLLVTLGLNFDPDHDTANKDDISHRYKVLLDSSSAETRAFFNDWTPSVPFQWLACRYVKRIKRGYFTNSWDIVRIISEELGYTVTEFLDFRGWSFHRSKKDASHCLRYHRFVDCVNRSKVDPEKKMALTLHFNAMLDGLWQILRDAHDKFPSSLSRTFTKDFSTARGFRDRVNHHVQVYHLCYAITLMVFKKTALSLNLSIEKLVDNIFGKLRTKRKILSALHTMLQYFPDEDSILKMQPTLLTWLNEPTLILRKLQSLPPGVAGSLYKQKLTEQIDNLIPSSKVAFINGSVDSRYYKKNVAVVRLRVIHLADQAEKSYAKSKTISKKRHKLGPSITTLPNQLPQASIPSLPSSPGMTPFMSFIDDEPSIEYPVSASAAGSSGSNIFYQKSATRCKAMDAILKPGSIAIRFPNSIQVATRVEMNDISCILVSEPKDNCTRVCQLSPLEVYYHSDLRSTNHRVSYLRDEPTLLLFQPSRSVQWVPLSTSFESFEFSVIRQRHALFKKYFTTLECDFGAILDFLTHSGTTDGARDGDGESVGMRYDFGVGNQSFDTSGQNPGFFDPPIFDCGLDKLQAHPQSKAILSSIGNVADAMQQLFDDHMENHLRLPKQQNDSFRNSMFSSNFCAKLGCLYARYEWGTLLAKCLSAGHIVDNHFDKNNCSSAGYRHTVNFSVVLRDSQGLLWRLSFLFNSRQAAGDFINREDGVKQFLSEIKIYLNEINTSYNQLLLDTAVDTTMLSPISWRTYDQLFLCDASPWVEYQLQKGAIPSVSLIELRAGITRDLWMSMATHALRLAKKALVHQPELIVELLLIALHQSGWLYFYLTITTMIDKHSATLAQKDLEMGAVASLYYEITTTLFGSFHCGVKTRFQVGGIDFQSVYLESKETMTKALSALREFVAWGEMAVGVGSPELLEKVEELLPSLPGIADFRMQMFLPLCGLSGLLPNNLAIVDVAFPVKGRGSYKSLEELGVEEDRFDKIMSLMSNHFEIKPHRPSWTEVMLCEKRESRQDVFDIFIKYQSISTVQVNNEGVHHLMVQEYNEQEYRMYTD